ncbi:MAG: DUF58 domain-containing protein [Bacteroidales bacterium]|nr:DUF58 domain-containing protein [Bacteroidales bacterium]
MKNLEEVQQYKEFQNLELLAKQVVEGFITGLHKSPYHGFSVEFAEHRLYNSGESTRHIDWKLFAKTEKLFVKRFEEETNLRCNILIDTSSSMLFPHKQDFNKLLFSVYTSAAIINMLSKQRDAVGLTFFSDEIQLRTDVKLNNSHIRFLYRRMQELIDTHQELNKKTSVAENLHKISEMMHKRSLVIIFSDMLENNNQDDIFNALQHLKHNKHEVLLFHVFDSKFELDFKYDNRPYRFVDLETGDTLKLNPNKVREIYSQKVKTIFDEIKLKAGQFGVDFVKADINKDFKHVLIQYLLKRQKLF